MASDKIVLERLRRGAEILGGLWREGQRCTAAWSFGQKCACPKRVKFCAAREQWMAMVQEKDITNPERRIDGLAAMTDHPFAMFELMLSSELEATGLTITMDSGVKVGPSGNVGCRLGSEISEGATQGGDALAMLLRTFRGSKVTKVERAATG